MAIKPGKKRLARVPSTDTCSSRPSVLGARRTSDNTRLDPYTLTKPCVCAMTNTVSQSPRTLRPFRYARDGVACFVLTVVANVCASITWEQYYGHVAMAPFAQGVRVEVHAATPIAYRPDTLPKGEQPIHGSSRGGTFRTSDDQAHPPSPSQGAKSSACPTSMQLVEGMHCPNLAHVCREYLSVARDRCRVYATGARCVGVPTVERFCIDRFEYPNRAGTKPQVAVSFREAQTACLAEGKRLCSTKEWELACEGPNRYPYPNGYERDAERCNIDRPDIAANNVAYAQLETREAEIARVDQREPSGSRPGCTSGYGVEDMTGNVDEWVLNDEGNYHKAPFRSALKGGYWGKVRNRCRPTTTDHNEWHSGYQVGFRCCAGASSVNGT